MAPEMTIGIPSFKRRAQLEVLLASVERAAASVDRADDRLEVVVVLDGSDDGSAEMLAERARRCPVPLRFQWQPNAGLAAARNALVSAARSELIWLVDDDMVVSSEALVRHLGHDRSEAPILMGPCDVIGDTAEHRRLAPYYVERHRRLAASSSVTRPQDCSFANTSVPTRLLADHPFDERFRGYGLEDAELAFRLLREGIGVSFDPAANVEHHCRPTPDERLRTMREAGRNMVRFTGIHPDAVDVAFDHDATIVERALRRIARPRLAGAFAGLANAVQWIGATWGPQRPGAWRIDALAEQLAVFAGVADAGGPPREGKSPPLRRP